VRFAEALAELDGRQERRIVPGLERIRRLAELLDDPHLRYPSIHVAGTNGKTTTSRLAAAVACAHGLPAGLYTSPHLRSVTERIAVCGEEISEEEFGEEYGRLLPYLELVDREGERVTYFEALTALAFLWFADRPVSVAVLEVGMGGRWDATNVVRSEVAVICEIGLDHPELGSTIPEVAGEKAGIVKPGSVVVCRAQHPGAMAVVEARCRDVGAPLLLEGRDFALAERRVAVGGQSLVVRTPHATYEDLLLPLFGEHQARNAAAAVTAFEAFLDRPLDEAAVREAMAGAASPGRMEVVARHPLVVLDGAHNPDGARALAAGLRESFAWERLHLVVAVSGDKDVRGVLEQVAPLADRAYAARHASPRSADPATVAKVLGELVPTEAFDDVASALRAARASAGERDLILVTGSLYTVADARRAIAEGTP
jgi:dihydrofolate synthase/folylpolyglutamate synthase